MASSTKSVIILFIFGFSIEVLASEHALRFFKKSIDPATQGLVFVTPSEARECPEDRTPCENPFAYPLSSGSTVVICTDKQSGCTPTQDENTDRTKNADGRNLDKVLYYDINENDVACMALDPINHKAVSQNVKIKIKSAVLNGKSLNRTFDEIDSYLASVDDVNDKLGKNSAKYCVTHGTGWINRTEVEEGASPLSAEAGAACVDGEFCKDEARSLRDQAEVIDQLAATNATSELKKYLKHIRDCKGRVDFGNITGVFSKDSGSKSCQLYFPEGCGSEDISLREKMTAAARLTLKTGLGSEFCKQVVKKGILDSCSTQKDFLGDDATKDKQRLNRFSKLRKAVRKMVASSTDVEKLKGVSQEGLLVCLFYKETTDFNPSALNYTACNKTQTSTAVGLGQLTISTLVDVVKKFPDHYPVYAKLVSDIETQGGSGMLERRKKAVEPLFSKISDREEMQINVTIETLVLKSQSSRRGSGVKEAVNRYGPGKGGKGGKTYASNIVSCASRCFKKSSETLNKLGDGDLAKDDLVNYNCMTTAVPDRGTGKTLKKMNPEDWAAAQLAKNEFHKPEVKPEVPPLAPTSKEESPE